MAPIRLTSTHRVLIGVVIAGAVLIAAAGFAGSYTAVRALAETKNFGWFALVFPLGIDAGIVVLLALDLLLTHLHIPYPLLRHAAWLLTTATIAFNAATAWPDPLGVAMHAVIPLLFITTVEAARHAIARLAALQRDRHIEPVRLTRWLLAPAPTFRLWRRMKLWELRSYDHALALERDRLVYRAHLRHRYGPRWKRTAPAHELLPLRLAKYGLPLPPVDGGPGEDEERTLPAPEPTAAPGPVPAAPPTAPVGAGERRRPLATGHLAAPAEVPASHEDPAPAAAVEETYFLAFCDLADQYGEPPTAHELAEHLKRHYGVARHGDVPVSPVALRRHFADFERRYQEIAENRAGYRTEGESAHVTTPRKGHTGPDPVIDVR